MSTVADYLKDAFRLPGIIGENDPVSAEQGADGIRVFNDMIGALRGDGIELGIAPQSSTTATLLVPEEDRLGVKYLLAVYLCQNYGREPSQLVSQIADNNYKRMLRRAVINDALENNAIMPLGEGNGRLFNINIG